jgi:hypothetical protein
MSFIKDLKFGLKYELEFLKYINYDTFEQSKGNFKDYDLLITKDDIETKYEIKSDRLAYKTNHICIEYEFNLKPSGITTTTSNFYGYFIIKNNCHDVYIIPTNYIKKSIEDKKYKKDMSGGDGKKAKFYLFDLTIFNEFLIK